MRGTYPVRMEVKPLLTLRTLHSYDERIWPLLSSSRVRSRSIKEELPSRLLDGACRLSLLLVDLHHLPPSSTMADVKATEKEAKVSGESEPGAVLADTEDVYEDNALDPVYQAKAKILNDAFQEIGMGRYQVSILLTVFNVDVMRRMLQWYLFIVAGFGWLSYVLHFFGLERTIFIRLISYLWKATTCGL